MDATPCTVTPTDPSGAPATPISLGWDDLVQHRRYLVRFAQARLRDSTLAEDAVHDLFETVLRQRASFCGRSSVRTWLAAVLRRRIVDLLRERARFESLDDADRASLWLAFECPAARPDEAAEHREHLRHTLARIDAMPQVLRSAITLRVLQDRSTPAVCQALGISESALFVRLHRARRHLAS